MIFKVLASSKTNLLIKLLEYLEKEPFRIYVGALFVGGKRVELTGRLVWPFEGFSFNCPDNASINKVLTSLVKWAQRYQLHHVDFTYDEIAKRMPAFEARRDPDVLAKKTKALDSIRAAIETSLPNIQSGSISEAFKTMARDTKFREEVELACQSIGMLDSEKVCQEIKKIGEYDESKAQALKVACDYDNPFSNICEEKDRQWVFLLFKSFRENTLEAFIKERVLEGVLPKKTQDIAKYLYTLDVPKRFKQILLDIKYTSSEDDAISMIQHQVQRYLATCGRKKNHSTILTDLEMALLPYPDQAKPHLQRINQVVLQIMNNPDDIKKINECFATVLASNILNLFISFNSLIQDTCSTSVVFSWLTAISLQQTTLADTLSNNTSVR